MTSDEFEEQLKEYLDKVCPLDFYPGIYSDTEKDRKAFLWFQTIKRNTITEHFTAGYTAGLKEGRKDV